MIKKSFLISGIGPKSEMQDCGHFFVEKNKGSGLYLVADCIGGQPFGQSAATLAINCFYQYFKTNLDTINPVNLNPHLKRAFELTQADFSAFINIEPKALFMGTAIAGLFIHNQKAFYFWSGDCRIYQIRNHQIIFSSIPHTWAYDRHREQLLTEEEAGWSVQNQLTASINNYTESIRFDSGFVDYKKGDRFLLCSDGVWNSVEQPVFSPILLNTSFNHLKQSLQNLLIDYATDNYWGYLIAVE